MNKRDEVEKLKAALQEELDNDGCAIIFSGHGTNQACASSQTDPSARYMMSMALYSMQSDDVRQAFAKLVAELRRHHAAGEDMDDFHKAILLLVGYTPFEDEESLRGESDDEGFGE